MSVDELRKIVEELKGASKMHAGLKEYKLTLMRWKKRQMNKS